MTDMVRKAAWDVLRAVDERDSYVNLLLPGLLRDRHIEGRDAALATELTHGTLRMRGAYDAIIATAVKKGLASVDAPVLDALRLGAHQLLSMRIPSHAAVSTTVDLVRSEVGHKPVAFTNAVLRKVASQDLDTWLDRVTKGKGIVEQMSIRHSYPEWIVEALHSAYGRDWAGTERLLAAQNVSPAVTLVARPGLCEPEELDGTEPGRLSPYARYLKHGDPGAIRAVVEGRAGVQDEGSQLVTMLLADTPLEGRDERWLDLCAGPGGKAALLAAIGAQRGASVVANEVRQHRAELVKSSLRTLSNASVTVHDGRAGPWEVGSFDRVLVDAPCTGLGALRRRPEARWRRKPEDLDSLVPLQLALLDRAIDLTRARGVTAYVTCSPHLAETLGVVTQTLARREDIEVIPIDGQRSLRLWPHVHGTDAMYVALLRKT